MTTESFFSEEDQKQEVMHNAETMDDTWFQFRMVEMAPENLGDDWASATEYRIGRRLCRFQMRRKTRRMSATGYDEYVWTPWQYIPIVKEEDIVNE